MTDIKTPEERSKNMAAIRSRDTKPEVYLRKLLFSQGYRYRKNVSNIYGRPDLWLAKYNTAIFVHGCFWHRHEGCKYAYTPKSKADFWNRKFANNVSRDSVVKEQLIQKGIKCLIVWECTIKKSFNNIDNQEELLRIIESFLKADDQYLEV